MALRDLIGEDQVNDVLKSLTDKYRSSSNLEANSIELLEEIYKVTPKEYHNLIDDWFKKVITYDLAIDEGSYQELADGTFEVSLNIKAKRFETNALGETGRIMINEPIKVGIFTKHPAFVKDESSILYYQSNTIQKEDTVIKIIVKELPKFISIDPFGTRSDENLDNNIFNL